MSACPHNRCGEKRAAVIDGLGGFMKLLNIHV
jgi:hypothetical protein